MLSSSGRRWSVSSVCVATYSSWVSISKAFYRAAMELCEAAQLCVLILGTQYFCLGVLKHVFGNQYAVYVLITHIPRVVVFSTRF